MRTCIRASCFLILFTIFSISILLSSLVAQSLPVVQGTYNSPPGQGLSPSQSALEQAKAAKVAAEEKPASAQTALETATAAEKAALEANAEQLKVAE
jgi:hypothetical protein